MKDLLKKGSIVLTLGTGGVGKTTISAALGLAASMRLNTALLTVDPSPRLRDALGLQRLGGEPVRLAGRRLAAAGLGSSARLSAMMLDSKGAWDSLVERFVTAPETRQRILKNPFYRSLTEQFAGSEAYAALEKLYDLHQAADFDLEIVDTPPAAYAFEFLQAPARLARLLDSRMVRWLFTPSLSAGAFAAHLASQTARFVMRELDRFAGSNALSSISEFFAAAAEAVEAMVERLRKTEALLHRPFVHFVLVTTAEPDRLRAARQLIVEMNTEGLRLSAIVVNRFLDEQTWVELQRSQSGAPAHLADIVSLAGLLGPQRDPAMRALLDFLEDHRRRSLEDLERLVSFSYEIPPHIRLVMAPEIQIGVRDLRSLAKIAGFLTGQQISHERLRAAASDAVPPHRGRPAAAQHQ